ncbi:MarR family transcriptional regulator [Hyphomicrobium sp.]|uniref:MarR family winged helix-turn-helix transcriptional regulator n=1 Tax=Hyphomicrobium sp. TaxID=82 RepID=UPI000FB4A150|nr:MAG: hypothetical protein EKK38_15715 [Hyphomicrobium sp.]
MKAIEITNLLLHLGRLLSAGSSNTGLSRNQWLALRFFAYANSCSRNVGCFSAHQSTSQGTASQIIKHLVEEEYLEQQPARYDGRSSIFNLTDKGKDVIAHDPLETFFREVEALEDADLQNLEHALRVFIKHFRRKSGGAGVCANCNWVSKRRFGNRDVPSHLNFYCKYFEVDVPDDDAGLLCSWFSSKS